VKVGYPDRGQRGRIGQEKEHKGRRRKREGRRADLPSSLRDLRKTGKQVGRRGEYVRNADWNGGSQKMWAKKGGGRQEA